MKGKVAMGGIYMFGNFERGGRYYSDSQHLLSHQSSSHLGPPTSVVKMLSPTLILTTLALLLPLSHAQSCGTINPRYSASFAGGLSAKVVMNGLRSPRDIIFDKEGNLLVIEQAGGGVRQVRLRDDGTNVCVASSKQIVNDAALNHGIELSSDGKTLYVSSLSNVDAYAYDASAGTATGKKTIINSMRNGGLHLTRTLLVSKKFPELIMVGRGSDGNIDTGAKSISTGRSMIRVFNLTEVTRNPVAYTTGGFLLGWGLRNPVGIGENLANGDIWSIDQGEDDVRRNNRDIHNTNPGEKLNFHGQLDSSDLGANYGYPECIPAYDTSVLGINGIQVGEQFWVEGYSQTAAQDANCKSRTAPRLVFPAHNSPIDIKFKRDGSAAYISWHGSWNRNPADGFRLDRVDFNADGQPKEPSTSTQAGVHVMSNSNMGGCPYNCFRPSGLAFDNKDRLFMSSDSTGEIFIINGA
ncbi:hypothetical protein BJ875DRAFT_289184 [Amylocarpus encephaloides]|uniref:Pyrroloquinoline quinone-dependent pyranose dehydrogenase beta-propeller domain-containing protein n=1 Tax=Amylocarpus encephaloides TaxID=45428 RepID=A0A9P8C5Q3_9HELO|nr:hypothetical protein BJ875DRAFT_289184 [Amylocarpus encephaloides]